jgi:hypothetical protein
MRARTRVLRRTTHDRIQAALHSAYAVDGQWRVVEVWRSRADADRFFAQQIAPHLPPGVRPKRRIYEAHSVVTAAAPGVAASATLSNTTSV